MKARIGQVPALRYTSIDDRDTINSLTANFSVSEVIQLEFTVIGNYIFINRVRQKLIDKTMGPLPVFVYFLVVTVFDGLQIIIMQVHPASVTPYTAVSAWGSGFIGLFFIVICFLINGGSKGERFLERYFTLCAVIGLWVVVPFQLLLKVPGYSSSVASIEWFVPGIILFVNLLIFGFLALQFLLISNSEVDTE